jgi:hypothetical protein
MVTFKLKVPNSKRYWKVFLFKTHNEMFKAKEKFKPDGNDDFLACVCPFEKWKWSAKKKDLVESNLMGHVYFNRKNLQAGVVSHELLHVSMNVERRINGNKRAQFGEECGEKEERLAYLLTDFTAQCLHWFYKFKVY